MASRRISRIGRANGIGAVLATLLLVGVWEHLPAGWRIGVIAVIAINAGLSFYIGRATRRGTL